MTYVNQSIKQSIKTHINKHVLSFLVPTSADNVTLLAFDAERRP